MKKINLYLDHLKISHNGEPEALNPYFRGRKNSYIVKVSLFSPGFNKNKPVEGAVSFSKIEKTKNFKPSPLEERHLFSCQVGNRMELYAAIYYLERRSFIVTLFENIFGTLAKEIIENLFKLELTDIVKLPAKILKPIWKVIKEGAEKNELIYEIGKGRLEALEIGSNEIALTAEEVKRYIMYMGPNEPMKRKKFEIVPQGKNGVLKVEVESE